MQRKNSITPADVLDGGFEAYVERSGPPLPPEHTRLTGDAAPSGAVRAAVLVSAGRVTPCVWGMVCPELPKRPSATHHSGGEPLRTGRFSVPRPSRAGYISYSCRPHRTCATQAAVIESPVHRGRDAGLWTRGRDLVRGRLCATDVAPQWGRRPGSGVWWWIADRHLSVSVRNAGGKKKDTRAKQEPKK